MPYKSVSAKRDRTIESIDKIFEQVDPEVMLAGALGAAATIGGLTPPFTKMMEAITGSITTSTDYGLPFLPDLFEGPGGWVYMLISGKDKNGNSVDPKFYAVVCSGALEGMLMMSFAKNPEAMKLLGEALGSMKALPVPI